MAPFNWFKRFNKPKAQSEADVSSAASSESTSEPQPSDTAQSLPQSADQSVAESPGESTGESAGESTEESPESNEQLDWAKAAYQMIQKRKSEAAAETAPAPSEQVETESITPEPVEPEPEAIAPTAEPVSEAVSPAPASQTSEPEAPDLEAPELETPEPEAAAPNQPPLQAEETPAAPPHPGPLPETISNPPTAEPASEAAADSPTEEPAAALPFWAQAEEERQQRLEQLKATAIEDQLSEEATPEPAGDDDSTVAFDDDFVWSAKVLAAQGRRPDDVSVEEITWLTKLRQGLGKTRRSLVNQLRAVVGQGPLNEEAVMEIESLLLQADVGIEATDYIIDAVQNKLKQEALPPDAAIAYLKEILRDILERPFEEGYSTTFAPQKGSLNIWLLTGVNGAGKTTTIGKLAHLSRKSDYSCLIAAADTFRAAAVEQVKIWGQRSGVEVIANPGKNTDPAAVVFDGIAAAQSRHADVLLVDTAGRLQNKKNLMDELSKIRRIIDKKAGDATVESLLVLDATLGQNGLQQAKVFSEAAQLSGVVLTKLDGTAKGGVALAVVQQLGLPIRFIGAGEGIEDLRPFSSYEFVEALLSG